ncbi:hypothetical protein B0T18DRAFT_404008 [Schizothecium vesticola]|uniref:Uncharacterized protein n=1 Tax=Schizothecium vesticola TaxID=314040 RepID=A0AA40F6H0_9PEZI|nr:hypothetical protein B0T18DRAFT_404008 [Schizothecium vesticola]
MPLGPSQGTFARQDRQTEPNSHRPSPSSQWTPFLHTSGTFAQTTGHSRHPTRPRRRDLFTHLTTTMQGRDRLWQCLFFFSPLPRPGLGNVACCCCCPVCPMQPSPLQPYEEGGSLPTF